MKVGKAMYVFGALFGSMVVWAQLYCVNYHKFHLNYDLLLYALLGSFMLLVMLMTLWFKW